MSIGTYIELRTRATIIRNAIGYDLSKAEANPVIFEEFVGDVLEDKRLPAVVWEPFAGHTGKSVMVSEPDVAIVFRKVGC